MQCYVRGWFDSLRRRPDVVPTVFSCLEQGGWLDRPWQGLGQLSYYKHTPRFSYFTHNLFLPRNNVDWLWMWVPAHGFRASTGRRQLSTRGMSTIWGHKLTLSHKTEQQNLDENNDQTCGSPSRNKGFKECNEKILHSISDARKVSQELNKLQSMVNELLSFSGT
jgi:hypothetical protein